MNRSAMSLWLGAAVGVPTALAIGCQSTATCIDTGTCTVSNDAGPDGADAGKGVALDAGTLDGADGRADVAFPDAVADAGDGSDGFICDITKDPKTEPCVLQDSVGVFVAPAAADAGAGDGGAADAALDGTEAGASDAASSSFVPIVGDGSMAHPFARIADALEHLGGKRAIFVCNGQYTEPVFITAPVAVYGGLSCAGGTWRWTGGAAQVTAPYALNVNAGAGPVVIEDMAFATPDADLHDALGNGASSVAALITSSNVSLIRCALTAGRGANGIDGTTQAANYSSPYAASGGLPTSTSPGTGGTNVCNYKADGVTPDSSTGGTGGVIARDPTSGAGSPGVSVPSATITDTTSSPPHDGAGGSLDANGDPGANGQPRSGGLAATSAGKIFTLGWSPNPGLPGAAGQPGQGGGGSGGTIASSVPDPNACYSDGAGGGAGGCGGSGGTGGGGGGGSIALISVESTVTLSACSLTTSQGGNGGAGGQGEVGQSGGPGVATCGLISGTGGSGAGGSGGGGGSAGISVGILYTPGGLPSYNPADVVIAVGPAGLPGPGGKPGAGPDVAGNPGQTGYLDPHASSATLEQAFSP